MARKCQSHKLSFLIGLLLLALAADSLMALRDLPLEVQAIKQIVLQDELTLSDRRCSDSCRSDADCKGLKRCTKCRKTLFTGRKICLAPNYLLESFVR